MRKNYFWTWISVFFLIGGWVFWIEKGKVLVRRVYFTPAPVNEESRTEAGFMALLVPRITQSGRFAMGPREFGQILRGLNESRYVSIGLQDLRDFYERGRRLPPKAVLLAFGDDDPQNVAYADAALRRFHMRGVLFLHGVAFSDSLDQRRFLSAHAARQMLDGGGWDFGAVSQGTPLRSKELGAMDCVLDPDGHAAWPAAYADTPFRFVASELGFNNSTTDPRALHIMTLHAETPRQTLWAIDESWPRKSGFADDFSRSDLDVHWIVGWGNVSSSRRRLMLLPTPRQTGAAVFLRGTEQWSDVSIQVELEKVENEFWTYVRYHDDGRFLRAGVRNGYWYVEQKASAQSRPSMLARSPVASKAFPATLRFIVKGDAAIFFVDGRMVFGRSLRINPRIDRGRVLLAVYNSQPRSTMATVASVEADPIGNDWIALSRGPAGRLPVETDLKELRAAAAEAPAITPEWFHVRPNGTLDHKEDQRELIASLAGFYHCRLFPAIEFDARRPVDLDRVFWGLTQVVLEPDLAGLNLRLDAAEARQTRMIGFLRRLKEDFHMFHRELWVTLDGEAPPSLALTRAVDGILSPYKALEPGLAIWRARDRQAIAGAGANASRSFGEIR